MDATRIREQDVRNIKVVCPFSMAMLACHLILKAGSFRSFSGTFVFFRTHTHTYRRTHMFHPSAIRPTTRSCQ